MQWLIQAAEAVFSLCHEPDCAPSSLRCVSASAGGDLGSTLPFTSASEQSQTGAMKGLQGQWSNSENVCGIFEFLRVIF